MQFRFSFKQMDPSEALRAYAEDKIRDKISKYATKPIEAHVTFKVAKHEHIAHCSVSGGDGFNVQVEHVCEDMYGSVDRLIDKLEVQLKRHKERLKGHKGRSGHRDYPTDMGPQDDGRSGNLDVAVVDAEDIIKYEQVKRARHG